MKSKLMLVAVVVLLAAMLFSLGGAASASSAAAGAVPQELQLTEQNDGGVVSLNGEVLVLNLESNPSTGYGWQVQGLDTRLLRQLEATEWKPHVQGKLGGWGTEVLRFAAVARGQASLHLVYARPWESAAPIKSFTVEVQVGEPSREVNYPQPAVDAGLPEAYEGEAIDALPSAYNWCSLGGCTPVRDQGNCGSCWAFGTVGPLESAILLQDGASKDLAEQYLVSCNTDAPCSGPYTHHETIADWVFIGGENSVPSTDAIKQAILDHGPVSAAVCVNSAFQSYTGGVFTGSIFCFSINHAIVLVGWDDSLGAWRLRNSWGPEWGEDGYMWIAYGKQYVGYSANYVVYTGSTPPAAPTSLGATAVSYSQVNLAWTDNADNETGFKIERCAGVGCSDFVQVAAVAANVASYANTGLAASTSYSYRVRAYNGAGDSDYTNTASAETLALPTPPAAPTSLTATAVSYSQVNLAWTDNATDETGFSIERCTGVDCSSFAQIATVGANVNSYANTGLAASTSYSYRVRATNAGGNSDYSNPATAVTQAPPPGAKLYLGSSTSGTAGGIGFADEDVLIKDMGSGAWALFIDGSDIGLANTDIDAFELLADGSMLMSFDTDFAVTGFATVDDSDIVRFTPTSTGGTTAGTWSWYFDGSDVGLSTSDEDVDAFTILADGRLIFSTLGNVSVTGASGVDEDLLIFTPTALGATTSGTWAVYFDGSDVGLSTTSNEDVNGVWVDAAGKLYLTTLGSFSVTGVSGDGSDIFICTPGTLGSTTTCTWSMYWDGSANGFSGEVTDLLSIVP
ncbi:MAG: protease inhibitor I42 family protein [Anaerolineales bacterium]|nr:protease inhibitor I42 family protein [Anaerolineales bacterium]